jgi:hypothetical protein
MPIKLRPDLLEILHLNHIVMKFHIELEETPCSFGMAKLWHLEGN